MANEESHEIGEGERVEPAVAFAHASLAVRQAAASGIDDFSAWGSAELNGEPLIIEDLNGQPLFYDFDLGRIGVVRASANSIVGSPVVSLQLGPHRWSAEEAIATASELARERLGDRPIETSLVCYCYPKIGVRVQGEDGDGLSRSMIFDAASFDRVERFGADELEGFTAYSFLDHAAREAGPRLRRWAGSERELEAWREAAPEALEGKPIDLVEFTKIVTLKAYAEFIPWFSWGTVRFAPRCARPEVFQLYAQETNTYCAVATGQMILDFYKYHFDQSTIATAMSTGSSGTLNPNQVAGYESLSNNGLDATYDTSASWSEAKSEIDANRPVKSGIYGHARAVAGWKRQNYFLTGSSPKRWLKVYDPSPWSSDICNGGAVYWEDWDSIFHTNWIYVRHS